MARPLVMLPAARPSGRAGRGAAAALLAAALPVVMATAACRRSRLPARADGAAVVVTETLPAAEQGVAFAVEVEPNNDLAAAQKLDFGAAAALGITGQLDGSNPKARDVDIYRVVIPGAAPADAPAADGGAPVPPPRRRLLVEVRPEASLATVVEALDDQGQPLLVAGGGQAGEPDGFPNLSVSPGTYFVRIKSAASSPGGAYRLVARLLPIEAGEENEPNGKAALASVAPPSGEVVGYYGWRRDQDWYRVPLAGLAEGSVLSVDLEPAPDVSATLAVYDAVEQKLTEVHGRKEERVALRNVRLPASEQHLFVVVRADQGRNAEVRYNLRLRAELPRAGGELEPNDDAAHAQTVGDGVTLGYLGRGDVDVFRYVTPGPVELDIEAAPPERVDLKLEVLRETDGLLLMRADTARRHEAERLPNLASAGGPLLIRVSGGKADGNPDEPYRLTIASRPPEPGSEREPNNSAATATPLGPGATGNGLLYPRGDLDLWQIAATPATDGTVPVTLTGVAGMSIDVRVSAPDGKELGRLKVAPGAAGELAVAAGGSACCLVQVREATGKAANARDRYLLRVGQ